MTPAQIAQAIWNYLVESSFSAGALMRVIAAVAAGKTVMIYPMPGTGHVVFRTISDSSDIVTADVVNYERTSITITP